MSAAGDQRWAPFPVQDWSTLPADLLAGPGGDQAWGRPPPARRVRRWWVPLVVLLCLGLVVGTATWFARRGTLQAQTAALAYVPADGDALWQQVDDVREAVTTTTTQVTESARFAGADGLLSGDSFLLDRALGQDRDDPSGTRLWRTTTTSVDETGIPSQTVRYHRVRGDVELAGERGPDGRSTAYEPALVELPADVVPGSAWSGTGSAGDTLDYASSFRAAAGRDGCLEVSGQVLLRTKGTQTVRRQTGWTRTWCPGAGVVAASEDEGATRTVATPIPAPAPGPRSTAPEPVSWTAPLAWTPRTWDTVTVDDALRTRAMYGSVAAAVHPVLTSSGLVVRALRPPDDVVATTPKTTDAWTPVWSVHPGGQVLALASFGSVVVVTTSERELVAYADTGLRLWRVSLREAGPTAPVRVSDDDAVVVDRSGRVLRFGIADGAVRWVRNVPGGGGRSDRAPATGAGVVVVVGRWGDVTALDAGDGTVRWRRSLRATAVAVVGDRVVVAADQAATGLDPVTGTTRYRTPVAGAPTALTGFAGLVVVASSEATLLLGPDGQVSARLPGYLAVDPTQTHLVGWTSDRLDVLGPDGRVVTSWPTPPAPDERPGLVTPQGVYLFGRTPGWTFDSWTTGG